MTPEPDQILDKEEALEEIPSAPMERYDLRILSTLRRIIHGMDKYSRKLKINYEITAPQLACLLEVAANGPLTSSAISKKIHLSASTVVGVLDRLEARGLIRRERDLRDRRLVYVTITDHGREVAESAPSQLQDSLAESLRALPELEQAAIALSLERIVDLMEARRIDTTPLAEAGPEEDSNPDNGI